jgi:hypothetical protein
VRLKRYVIPRLSNAHNFSMASLPVYRFLCDLQYQGICSNLGFSWGSIDRESLHLPRIIYKNMILHPAMWNIPASDLKKFTESIKEDARWCSIQELRKKFRMPMEILLCQGDNELWINLQNHHCLSLLQNEIKGMDHIVIKEYLANQSEALVNSGEGAFANECVFFMHRSNLK